MQSKDVLGKLVTFAIIAVIWDAVAKAADQDLQQTLRTAYLDIDFGSSTYKSKLELQNDTGYTSRMTVGAYVGDEKNVNIRIIRETAPVTFEINSGSIKPVWNQTAITYRLGYFYLGPVLSSVAMEVTKDNAPLFTVTGSGYGGATGILCPISKSALLYLDVVSGMTSQIQEKEQKEVTFGPRMNVDLGASVALTKRALDFLFGYRYMTHTITYDGTANAEKMTTTYLGLSLGFDF